MPPAKVSSQSPYRCRLEWGPHGAARAAARGDIVVIVDVLSFSTAVAAATSRCAVIYPLPHGHHDANLSLPSDAVWAVGRGEVPSKGKYSLSPLTFESVSEGECIVLPSLNGGTCCDKSRNAPRVYFGALLNAKAVAAKITEKLCATEQVVTVVACGEREVRLDGSDELRFAIEDYLGAGAVISHLNSTRSPEAQVCEAAFVRSRKDIHDLIWESVSGRELRALGFGADVSFAARVNSLNVCPRLDNVNITVKIVR